MANALDSIDPNDLDSIDALLDEAEIESISESAPEMEPDLPEQKTNLELDSLEDDPTDSLLDDLEADLASTDMLDSAPEIDFEPAKPTQFEKPSVAVEQKPVSRVIEDEAESFLEKRAAANAAQQNNQELTVAEMDSIKKLIIIFGSIVITLALVGIGIGVWGALSAGKGLDEESTKMLEDIKVGTQQNTQKASDMSNVVKGVEKKMDALSFQLEQINNDLSQLDQLTKASVAPLDLMQEAAPTQPHAPNTSAATNNHNPTVKAPQVVSYQPAPVTPVVMAQADPEVGEKLSKVSAQIVTAQARIAEVNKRLKEMQAQYSSLLTSVKTVEKEVISAKVEKAKEKARLEAEAEAKLAEKNVHKTKGTYQYSVPGFDYNNNRDGSYP